MLFEVPPGLTARRRIARRLLWYITWIAFAFLLTAPIAFQFLKVPGSEDLARMYLALGLPAAILGVANWVHTRRTILAANRIAITSEGVFPPFKPKQRLSKRDWFVPYKDVISMEPVAEKGGLVLAYDVTPRDGLSFQLNALDLLLYVDEKEVRRYARMLAVIRTEIDKPENRARADRGEDVIIPSERFTGASGGSRG